MKKKVITIFLLFVFTFGTPIATISKNVNSTVLMNETEYQEKSSQLFEGFAEINTEINPRKKEIFTGEVEEFGEKRKDFINMTVSQVLSSGFTEEGDEFFAEITNDVVGDKGIILPAGTIAHGTVREIEGGKRMGRNGWIEMHFDSLITPDGREIPIEGEVNTKGNLAASIAKGVGITTVHTIGGGLAGGYLALNLLGLEAAIASQGYTLLGGAAIGGAVGLGVSLWRKGKDALISPGDEIKVRLNTRIELPVLSEEAFKQEEILFEGLNIKITNISLEEDPFGEKNTYGVNLVINNFTNKSFSSMDIALTSETNKIYYPSVFGENTLMFKTIDSNQRTTGRLTFAVDNPKRKHWLVFFDRQTRKPLTKISLDNAKREIEKKQKNQKRKKKK